MHIEPSAQTFAARYAAGEPQVVWTKLVADLETPVSAYLKVAGGRSKIPSPMGFLLESVEGGAVRGRYSIIGLDPDLIFRVNGKSAEINRTIHTDPAAFVPVNEPPLKALRALIAESRIVLPAALPPMAAGVFGYLGYDMVRLMEDLPQPGPRCARHSRCDPGAADRGHRLRCGRGHDHRRHAGAAACRCDRKDGTDARRGAARRGGRCARPAARKIRTEVDSARST